MAVDLMEMLKGAVSQQVMGKLGGALGMDTKKSSSAFEMAAGAILGGLMKKASSPAGAKSVFEAVKKQDSSILDKLGDLMGGGQQTEQLQKTGGGLLETILGGSQAGMLTALAKALGIDKGVIGKLMAMVAPIIMAVIGKHMKAKALDAVGLGGLLGDQKSSLGKYMPASLTNDLGFGNLLGNATNSAKQMGNTAKNAANDAAATGGGLVKVLLPLAVIALLGFLGWKFLMPAAKDLPKVPKSGDTVKGVTDSVPKMGNPGLDFSGLDLSAMGETGTTLKNGFGDITKGLSGLKDEAGAKSLSETITGFSGKLDGLGLDKLKGVAKTGATTMIGKFVETITQMLDKVPGPLKAVIQPAIDGLMAKLKPFAG